MMYELDSILKYSFMCKTRSYFDRRQFLAGA